MYLENLSFQNEVARAGKQYYAGLIFDLRAKGGARASEGV